MVNPQYILTAKKFLKFLVIVFLIDFSLGSIAKILFFKQETGKYARITYSVDRASEDILIFGSSHANRHYIPEIFERELDLTCYNAGVQGQKLIFQTALQEMILSRTTPELLVLNIDPNWLYQSGEAYDRLSDFNPYYWEYRDILKPVLSLNSMFLDLKLLFKSYQTNSTIIHMLRYFVAPQKDYQGYRPLYGQVENTDNEPQPEEGSVDPNFVTALQQFITNAREKNIKVLFLISPTIHHIDYSDNESMNMIKEIASAENVPMYNFIDDPFFQGKPRFFNDPIHLNDEGARLYSEKIAALIKEEVLDD